MAKKNKGKSVQSVPVQFDPAEEVEKIAKKLIPKYHSHLATCNIAYLFKNKPMKSRGREVCATAEKVSKKNQALSGYHFIITVAYPTWKDLSEDVKRAVVDHELEHCFAEDDEKTGEPKYSILPHDVEEFGAIIRRHGLYTTNLVRIGHVVEDALEGLSKDVVVKKVGEPEEDPEEEEEEDAEEDYEDEEEDEEEEDEDEEDGDEDEDDLLDEDAA